MNYETRHETFSSESHILPQGAKMKILTVAEAARLVGKDRKTLYRMMDSGQLSFNVQINGRKGIDPAELWRVFPKSVPCHSNESVSHNATDVTDATEKRDNSETFSETNSVAILQAQLDAALAREKVALEREQAAMERERQAVARETWLRERLAESERERLDLAHRLLPPGKDATDETETQTVAQDKAPRKSWWQRLFG